MTALTAEKMEPFFATDNRVWSLGLRPIELSVLSRILYRANLKHAFSIERRSLIAEACCCSVDSVRKALSRLEVLNVITRVGRFRKDGGRMSSELHLNDARLWKGKAARNLGGGCEEANNNKTHDNKKNNSDLSAKGLDGCSPSAKMSAPLRSVPSNEEQARDPSEGSKAISSGPKISEFGVHSKYKDQDFDPKNFKDSNEENSMPSEQAIKNKQKREADLKKRIEDAKANSRTIRNSEKGDLKKLKTEEISRLYEKANMITRN